MRSPRWILAVLAVAALVPALPGDDKKPAGLADLMQRKLKYSQKALEGIALNDYDKIAESATELIAVSQAADWKVLKSPEYQLHSNDFRRSAESMRRMANAKNVDGAALAYVDMTLTCVKCHKHVREVRMTRNDWPSLGPHSAAWPVYFADGAGR
jgi:hypothetical protein